VVASCIPVYDPLPLSSRAGCLAATEGARSVVRRSGDDTSTGAGAAHRYVYFSLLLSLSTTMMILYCVSSSSIEYAGVAILLVNRRLSSEGFPSEGFHQ